MTVTGVIDAFLHPPVELLTVTDAGLVNPYTGGLTDLPFLEAGRLTYGLTWQVTTAPPGAGNIIGVIRQYELRVMQVVVFNALHVIGPTFAAEVFNTDLDSGAYFYQFAFPQGVSCYITPGFEVTFNWLVALA